MKLGSGYRGAVIRLSPALLLLALLSLACLLACENSRNTQAAPSEPSAPVEAPAAPAPTKPAGTPALSIDSAGPSVGSFRANMQYPEAPQRLAEELSRSRELLAGKEAKLAVDRQAKPEWVALFLAELAELGVPRVVIQTTTRAEFPGEVAFTPERNATAAPPCSVVVMILEDRATAVWRLSGGVAGRRPRGMAGPDLSMTGDSIVRVGKACKAGASVFVAGAKDVEWGLLYDLAASTKKLPDVRFEHTVLLGKTPVPGHSVR